MKNAKGVLKATMFLTKLKIAAMVLMIVGAAGVAAAAEPNDLEWKRSKEGGKSVPERIRSAHSGPWSEPATWEGGKVPGDGTRVQIRAGHTVTYDVHNSIPARIRSIHIAGTLTFARDRNTLLSVGLIKIQPGDDASENGFDCDAHLPEMKPGEPRPALEVGTPNEPIPANHTATIQLCYFEGMDKESCPAIVCCGGRMDFHGAPVRRAWVKLGAEAKAGSVNVMLAEPVPGWRVGDRVILPATVRQVKVARPGHLPGQRPFKPSTRDDTTTEERFIQRLNGTELTLDRPLTYDHQCQGAYRGEVANLSRNLIVESQPGAPSDQAGHTMYHRHSAGSISYAEFRRLGKEGVLGRYSLHFHLAGDTMRGSSVIGASIWDAGNRWLTIHGTNFLVVRDCVGYRSKGHGFFLEDGTEAYNVLDRNLAVQAYTAKPLPNQVFPFDKNDGAGFWWANSLNAFTRNVACECDEYGYFFQAAKTADFDPVLPVLQPNGRREKVDIRTLPFVRFEDNEAHCQRRHAFNLGGGVPFGKPNVDGVGPDAQHPFVIRNYKAWNVHWAIHPVSPSVLLDNLDIYDADYGVWRPEYNRHAYHALHFSQTPQENHYGFGGKAPNEDKEYPKPLDPVDDLPPVTVITHVSGEKGKLTVRGTASDNGIVKRILVNGREAHALAPNFAEWEIVLEDTGSGEVNLVAHAEDAAGNIEKMPHVLVLGPS
ncbi:MAG TPA: G8 domain-containing protein [Gemmataceae bacterium]|nr:G8 domain-containing protein [Gemmataceae bacterium]